MLASPLCVIEDGNLKSLVNKVAAAARENEAGEVVVGNPISMNGTAGERSQKSGKFCEELSRRTNIPVKLWDERTTTVLAHNILAAADTKKNKRKKVIDEVAAVLILESYLEFRKNKATENNSGVTS
jgi:putative Holliday junction resolvase